MTVAVIEVTGVSRTFGPVRALDEASVSVGAGEVVGLLGHNGAGKTTLLRIVNGLLRPDSGTVRVLGLDPLEHGREVRTRTGVVTESLGLDDHLSARENLEAFAAMYGVAPELARPRIDRLLDEVELPPHFVDGATQQLSAGLRQRVAIARAFVHHPDVLLLDEPTSNLDPLIARKIRGMIREAAATGRAVIVCTHNLPEAQATCDRLVILRRGEVLASGSLEELGRRSGSGTLIGVDPGEARSARATLETAGMEAVLVDEAHVRLTATDGEVPGAVRLLVDGGYAIHRVEPQLATLEDLYISLHSAGDAWTG